MHPLTVGDFVRIGSVGLVVAEICMEAIDEERFLILPHQQVQGYIEFKAQNPDKWLAGMRTFQNRLFIDEPLPGDAMRDFTG